MARFDRRLDHPDRLLHPMRRVGPKGEGRFERIDWDSAIALVATQLAAVRDEHGGEAILPFSYGGSNGYLTDSLTDSLLFARLGATRLDKNICAAPTTAVATGMYGKMPGVPFPDYERARCIIVWGANPGESNIHLVPYIRRAREAGAFVALVDPRRTMAARDVDLHLPVLPGADLPLALALIGELERRGALDHGFLDRHADGLEPLLAAARRWPLERAAAAAGVDAGDIERLAAEYVERSPAVVRCGWGLERNKNGGQAVAAVLALPALAGKFETPGGGYTMSNGGAYRVDGGALLGPLDWRTRQLDMTRLGRHLTEPLDPPVKALFVYNANPVATVPGQDAIERGLRRDDLFTVVFEQVMTDTCVFADVLLPATTFLEHWDLRGGYGSYYLGGVRPAIPPRGEARSNQDVFAALGRALGFADEAFSWTQEEAFERLTCAVSVEQATVDVQTLADGRGVRPEFPGERPAPFETTWPRTADRRIQLTPEVLGPSPYTFEEPDVDYPLAFITPASGKLISSTFGEHHLGALQLTIHPEDAAPRGLADGDAVRVYNDLGEVRCEVLVSDAVRPGVVAMPKGAWRKSSANGKVSTALCPDTVQTVADGACFNDARVEVERLHQPVADAP